jgi:hypothetical protein
MPFTPRNKRKLLRYSTSNTMNYSTEADDVHAYHFPTNGSRPKSERGITEKSPLNSNSSSAGQELPRNLRKPKVHYRIHNSRPPAPTLSRSIQSMAFPTEFRTFRSVLVLPSAAYRFSKWSLSFRLYIYIYTCVCYHHHHQQQQ